jgi:radical SAM protein with 4Fe4S-binding SPASM domain
MKNVTYVYIETTNYCNLNCTFCNRKSVIDRLNHMPISKFKILLDKIKHYSINEAKLMGMGEPFFHPKYHEICELFKMTFPNSKVISSTNCQYKITHNFKESLKYIDILYLSIDGYKENYEKYRKPAKWNKLIQFLDELEKLKHYNCEIVINYVVNTGNVFDIDKIYNNIFLRYKYISKLWLNIAQNWSEDKNINIEYTDEQINYLKYWKNNIKGKENWNYSDCFWPQSGLYINVNGDVKMCCLNTNTESFGSIFEKSFDEIRNRKNYIEVKNGCEKNSPTAHCKNCSYKELAPLLYRIKNDD